MSKHQRSEMSWSRDGHFGIADLLGGKVDPDLVGQRPDVLRVPDEVGDGQVDLDEVGEVGEGEIAGERLPVGRHRSDAGMAMRELGDRIGRRRADVVHVQLGFGQTLDEGPEVTGHRGLSRNPAREESTLSRDSCR